MVIEEGSAVAVLQRGTTVVVCQNTTWFKDTVYNAGCETYFYLEWSFIALFLSVTSADFQSGVSLLAAVCDWRGTFRWTFLCCILPVASASFRAMWLQQTSTVMFLLSCFSVWCNGLLERCYFDCDLSCFSMWLYRTVWAVLLWPLPVLF